MGSRKWTPYSLAAVSRFVVSYGGLVRGGLAARETLIMNGATGAYGRLILMGSMTEDSGKLFEVTRSTWRAQHH
jgi:alcohol dehydrogenase